MTTKHPHPRRTATGRWPGDPDRAELVRRMIRVDHAGEFGAKRIYAGQLAVLGRAPEAAAIREMAEEEERHLKVFEQLIVERRVRPTVLQPLWHVVGFALGAATALLGGRAAMACTVAVEEVIDEHYARQVAALGDDEAALRSTVEEFRQHEVAHKETALAHGAEAAPAYPLLASTIKAASRLAIWLSTRI
ncbi:MAG: demethoxyubiquinone hydroxylase family protein [Alphaproteobacteria bacterium]